MESEAGVLCEWKACEVPGAPVSHVAARVTSNLSIQYEQPLAICVEPPAYIVMLNWPRWWSFIVKLTLWIS